MKKNKEMKMKKAWGLNGIQTYSKKMRREKDFWLIGGK